MATPTETEPTNTLDESAADNDQESRLKRYDQRIEEWLTSLMEGADQRSPEVLRALATKAKEVGEYLDKMAERARSKSDAPGPTPSAEVPRDESTASAQDPGPSTT